MSKVVDIPNLTQVYDEASDWVVKFDRTLTKSEETKFKEWIHTAPENKEVFMSMAHLWDDMDGLSRLTDLFPEPAHSVKKTEKPSFIFNPAALAAVFMVMAVGIAFVFGPQQVRGTAAYETSVGEHSTISLPDGSTLVLNTNSLIKVDFTAQHRLITLERGEMHIDVAHDKQRPLSVKAGESVVQAVGTAFNVELLSDKKLELIVVDGKVRVGDRSDFEGEMRTNESQVRKQPDRPVKPVFINPESLAISKGEKVLLGSIEPVPEKIDYRNIENSLSWRTGNLVFRGETLEQAIEEISRYTSVEFKIENPLIKNVRIAGLFKTGDVNGLLNALDESFNISSKRINNKEINLYIGDRY